jgi:hypothetical protein
MSMHEVQYNYDKKILIIFNEPGTLRPAKKYGMPCPRLGRQKAHMASMGFVLINYSFSMQL